MSMPIEKLKELTRYKQIKALYDKYERILIPATLVFGVIVDSVTFTSIDIVTAFILLGVYFLIAGAIMLFMNAYDAHRISQTSSALRYLRLASSLIIQFTFGALLSASFIFYLFSGSLAVSWPFIAVIVVLMISNDVFRKYYLRPRVQIGVYFFILFSFAAIVLPFVFSTISVLVFLFSGTISLLLIFGYIALLTKTTPSLVARRTKYSTTVVIIFICMNALYFLNIIPPIPLSIRDSVVAHSIQRIGGGYSLRVEEPRWYDRFVPGTTINSSNGLAVYTAIFAPDTLRTTIVHQWEYFDEQQDEWVKRDRLPFTIIGGREAGFRGYSRKTRVQPGKWRVSVETEREQVLGRVSIHVRSPEYAPELTTIQK